MYEPLFDSEDSGSQPLEEWLPESTTPGLSSRLKEAFQWMTFSGNSGADTTEQHSQGIDELQVELKCLTRENYRLQQSNQSLQKSFRTLAENHATLTRTYTDMSKHLHENVATKEDLEHHCHELKDALDTTTEALEANSIRRIAQGSSIVGLAVAMAVLLGVTILGPLVITPMVARVFVLLCIGFLVLAMSLPRLKTKGK